MPERIVVSFRGVANVEVDGGQGYLDRAQAIKARAEKLGANLCAWSAQTFSFELNPDELEKAIVLAQCITGEPRDDEDEASGGTTHGGNDGNAQAGDTQSTQNQSDGGKPNDKSKTPSDDGNPKPGDTGKPQGKSAFKPPLPPAPAPPPVENERFRAGISQGAMSVVGEGGGVDVLSWGTALLNAVSLARVARPGEILLDPKLVAARPGELLLQGMRVAMDAGKKVRGARLDVRMPWRKLAARNVTRLKEPALTGRDGLGTNIGMPLGCIGIIRADAGAGGTRLLAEITARLTPSRTLLVTPVGASREPLGAIRRALSRSAALHGTPPFPEHLKSALTRLLAGEGTDRLSAAELVNAWLSPTDGRFGVLAIDDASEIDSASLEAIAGALAVSGELRALVRLDSEEPLPPALTTTPIGSMMTVLPLEKADSEKLAASFTGGALAPEAAKRWAKRGGGWPLGIREALAESIITGDLCYIGDVAVPRRKSSGRGGIGTPRYWIERRMAYLASGERATLLALAMLGGDAADTMIDALAVGMGGPGAHSAVVVEPLIAAGWVVRPEPGWLKLTSRTARDALVATLNDDARRQWNLAAAGMMRHYSGMLGHADAAWYASQAGDHASAAELAMHAARTAESASLEAAAQMLREFARGLDAHVPSMLPESVRIQIAASLFPPPATSRYPFGEEGSLSPPGVPSDIEPPSDLSAHLGLIDEQARVEELDIEPDPEGSDDEVEEPRRPTIELDPEDVQAVALKSTAPVSEASAELAELAKQALVQGDLPTLERLIAQLRMTGEYSELVERMSGFVALGRGAKTEALRKLRAAADIEQTPAQRARALLAYGVALAATGHTEAALLETLDALSRAREIGDAHGEEACARFLARLSSATGHSGAAVAWANVVKRVSVASRG